jgi:hypothetical protein
MKTDGRTVLIAINSCAEEPTPASTRHAFAGSPCTDELLERPADLCARTNVIRKRTEAYRFVWSPPYRMAWPPRRFPGGVVLGSGQRRRSYAAPCHPHRLFKEAHYDETRSS